MKTKIFSILVFAALIGTGAASPAQAQPCSNASLKGTYGFHGFATVVLPGNPPGSPGSPRAIIGIFTLDGLGGFTYKLMIDDNGTILLPPPEGHGTYIVNADCTGTILPSAENGGGSVALVVVDGGKEFYQMRTEPASIVLFGTTKKVSSGDNGGNQQ